MQALLKYFEIKYNFKELIYFIKSDGLSNTKIYSISHSKVLQFFFNIILDYYYSHDIRIDYNDKNIDNKIKSDIIKKLYPIIEDNKAGKLFNMMDFMFSIFKKILINTNDGFIQWVETIPTKLRLSVTLLPNLDLFFYIIFINVFNDDLKGILKRELHISNLEYDIINKCHNIIIRNNNRICNISENSNKTDLSLSSSGGMIMILKIFNDLRSYSNRRPSKRDDLY